MKVGDARFAFKFNAVWVAVDIGFNKSVVLSTFPNPTIVLSIPPTVPVKVGDARFAFSARLVVTSEAFAFNASPGTVGKAAVPPKSPANCNLPFVEALASGVAALNVAST